MITQSELHELLVEQARANASTNAYWMDAGYPLERHIGLLTSGAVAPRGWAWPQYRARDVMVKMLGGMWRCIMSRYLAQERGDVHRSAQHLHAELGAPRIVFFDLRAYEFASIPLVGKLELTGALALAGRVYPALFDAILDDCEVSWRELLERLVHVNVLTWESASFRELANVGERCFLAA
ncbi:hypothetical protein [Burkholderia ubonensis]|uniref:hypothetical protein n=1 Tax=Burkholderia ubonensis TaxID=101571 RepID=UPI00075480CB|nr:hypothetical protein [Burkholderia ubonensis]KVV07412.1 hypothetical protein WK77_16630 [Burkholderia ubonensis]